MASHRCPGEHMYGNMVLESGMPAAVIDRMQDMRVVDGDILITTYPKTGTTWTQEMVWMIQNNCDAETAKKEFLMDRTKFLEYNTIPSYGGKTGFELIEHRKSPEIMKTHMPAWIFEKQIQEGKLKILVVIRNPKDTLVSFYHFYQINPGAGNFSGSWDDFFNLYKTKHVLFGDYFEWYESWLPYLDQPNVKLLSYEDMKLDMPGVITDVAEFLGTELTQEQKDTVLEHTSFGSMRKHLDLERHAGFIKDGTSAFMRKGVVGDWKNYFSEEQSDYVDARYDEILKSKGINLIFE